MNKQKRNKKMQKLVKIAKINNNKNTIFDNNPIMVVYITSIRQL